MRGVAGLAERQGNLEEARSFAESSLSLARSIGDDALAGEALLTLGTVAGDAEDYDGAESLQREALAVFSRSGNDTLVRETLAMLGFLMIARKDYAQARSVIEEALRLSRQADDPRGVLVNVANFGHLSFREGRFQEALPLMREALQRTHQQLDVQGVTDTLEDIAAVAAAQRHHEEAAVILGGADALREGTQAVMEPVGLALHEETLSSLSRNLDADCFAAAWEHGRRMSLEQAVAHAVECIDWMQQAETIPSS